MDKIIHRINTIKELKKVPRKYGVEVDVRTYKYFLILNHEPYEDGVSFDEYLRHFKHKFLIVDIKEEGIEKKVINLLKKHKIKNYFLLGVTPPQIYKLFTENKFTQFATRLSELERPMSIESDWFWCDTFSELPFKKMRYFRMFGKLCLVCPSRWGRPKDIKKYKKYLKDNKIKIDAVMTSLEYAKKWE